MCYNVLDFWRNEVMMDQVELRKRLEKLVAHWIEHNDAHAEEFRAWADKAESAGDEAVAESIMQAAEQMGRANAFLLAAAKDLKEG